MAVVIRLQRAGARNRPFYRLVVTDSRKPRDGAFLEKVGFFDPIPDPDVVRIDEAKIDAWIGKGAKPTEAAKALIKRAKKAGTTTMSPEPSASAAEAPVQEANEGSATEVTQD